MRPIASNWTEAEPFAFWQAPSDRKSSTKCYDVESTRVTTSEALAEADIGGAVAISPSGGLLGMATRSDPRV